MWQESTSSSARHLADFFPSQSRKMMLKSIKPASFLCARAHNQFPVAFNLHQMRANVQDQQPAHTHSGNLITFSLTRARARPRTLANIRRHRVGLSSCARSVHLWSVDRARTQFTCVHTIHARTGKKKKKKKQLAYRCASSSSSSLELSV